LLLAGAAYGLCGCVAALGPGYTIQQQTISVEFAPAPSPVIHIEALYRLKNTGNQPLDSLELRLPGRRRFHFADPQASWDKAALAFEASPDNPRNVLLKFPRAWMISAQRELRLSVAYQPASTQTNLSFTPSAFFLPAEGWSPELLPARGSFATGGVPPDKWDLIVKVPESFLVHASGQIRKQQKKAGAQGNVQVLRAVQDVTSGYPFVIAGRFESTQLELVSERVNVWTLSPQDKEALRNSADTLIRTIQTYNAMFGHRLGKSTELWIVECPVVAGCFSSNISAYQRLVLGENEKTSAEMASTDSVMLDLTGGPPRIAAAAPSLASSWLGYGRNPGFYEQDAPLSALPAFAAARGREAATGGEERAQTVRRLLRAIPEHATAGQPETGDVLRAKSLLFFYGLQDRYGRKVCDAGLQHMLQARSGRGFDLDDLIAALEEESHQNVAEFVRVWMKQPGVPKDFRSRYAAAETSDNSQEKPQ